MTPPDFTLDKIKFATDVPTFEKAVALYESDKVTQVEEGIRSYTGVVVGTKPYRVSVEARNFRYACYVLLSSKFHIFWSYLKTGSGKINFLDKITTGH